MIQQPKHIAIYVTAKVNKDLLIHEIIARDLLKKFIDINSLKTAIFSTKELAQFIDEELRHDQSIILKNESRLLITFSEGEKRKLLLDYLFAQKPNCIILENIFDHLDIASQTVLRAQLNNKKAEIIYIQIVNRKSDILDCIDCLLTYDTEIVEVSKNIDITHNSQEQFQIPQTINHFEKYKNPLIEFKNVSLLYNEKCIFQNINWKINAGEFWQLIGPNGSGKSSLLSMITGDNPKAYNQNLILFGKKKGSGESVWEIKAKIGYVTASMTQYFERRDTVENMVIGGLNDSIGLYIQPTEIQIQQAHDWLKVIGLFEQRKKAFVDLAEGYQRLILIARAMIKQPPLLILDEPTTGLDDHDASVFTTLINKISKETNTAILYVSHRKEENIKPDFVFELLPSENGSLGSVLNHKGTTTQSFKTL